MNALISFLPPLREKVDRAARRMGGLSNASSSSRSTIPLIRQSSAVTFSLKGRRQKMESK